MRHIFVEQNLSFYEMRLCFDEWILQKYKGFCVCMLVNTYLKCKKRGKAPIELYSKHVNKEYYKIKNVVNLLSGV